jgi:uncharacterized protein involved in exopolysaccharide biosynthesis
MSQDTSKPIPQAGPGVDPGRPIGPPGDEDVIHLLPIVNLLLINRRAILLPAIYLMLAVWVLSLFMSPVYTATASFMNSSESGMADKLSGPANMRAMTEDVSAVPEYYAALLNSGEFLAGMVKRQFQKAKNNSDNDWLLDLVGEEDDEDLATEKAVDKLKDMVSLKPPDLKAKRMIMELSVKAKSEDVATSIAASVLDAIMAQGGDERTQKAIENRDFIQLRLRDTEQGLREAETAWSAFLTRNHKIDVPRLAAENQRLERAVKVQEELFMSLRKELELAKIKVQENKTLLKILEQPSAKRTGPKRLRIAMISFLLGLMLMSGRVLVRDRLAKMDRNDPDVHLFMDQIHGIESDLARWRNALHGFVRQSQGWLLRRFGR